MDDYTKGLLERNEKRNKALGIATNTNNKHPVKSLSMDKKNKENKRVECNSNAKVMELTKKVSSPRKSANNEISRPATTRTISSKSKDDADVNVEINITTNQHIQVEVEVAECEIDEDGQFIRKEETVNTLSNYEDMNKVSLRDSSRKNLKRLGVLYSDNDQISSPIQRTEEHFCEEGAGGSSTRPIKKFTKLVSLASNINSWDDDYSHHQTKPTQPAQKLGAIPKTLYGSPAKTNPQTTVDKSKVKEATASTSSPSKKLMWDKKVIDSLEQQGFTRRESTVPKLVYDYTGPAHNGNSAPSTSTGSPSKSSAFPLKSTASPSKSTTVTTTTSSFLKPADVKQASPAKKSLPKPSTSVASSVKPGNKLNEQKTVTFSNNFPRNQKDPADLSLKDRMAIFEKNKGTALLPKCAFGIAESANPIRSNMEELNKKFNFGFNSQQELKPPAPKEKVPENAAKNIKTTVTNLLQNKEQTISEKQISDNVRKQREEDMKCILNRFNKQPEIQNDSEDTQDAIMVEEKSENGIKRRSSELKYTESKNTESFQKSDDKKRVRVSNPKRIYPVLSDIESTTDSEMDNYTTATVSGSEVEQRCQYSENPTKALQNTDDQTDSGDDYSDDDVAEMSFGRDILNSVRNNEANNKKLHYMDSTTSSVDASDVIDDMDDYLNEALETNDSNYDDKGSACSESFEYEKFPKRVSFKDTKRKSSDKRDSPITSRLEISPSKTADGMMTLVHTVSFYRRQQSASASNTPVKKVLHKPAEETRKEHNAYSRRMKDQVDEKVKKLLEEVCKQQTVISQTSQALNLCASTIEFSGSTEAVEGERHLLVASHRRQACMNEMQRLKVEGVIDREGPMKEKGTLTIRDITVPLKQTYISRLANDEIAGHHLVCILKYNENVLATKTVPSLPGLKSVRFPDTMVLNEVYADFKITLEIYGMTAQRELLPHDIKYHITTPNNKKKSRKHLESHLSRPHVQSPGGPGAVRTPALVQYGYIIFSIREIKQKSWVINETAPSVSPLNGNVFLKIDSKITVDVDHCGFLTMFDDISGFGAWHRRWCRLSGNTLYYWKYPEDEKRKETLGQLDLTNIVTDRVEVAPRAVCARLNTILLESKRERRDSDVDTLVLVPSGKHTLVRHLLAADTKEEREEWCQHLNKSLSLMKSWGNQH